ncbi:helix-turn-helix domain-containing protein [Paenarthrobacter sp. PH39-S1]|uniref:helix-turn-helix domain-containing protein n=1 Tax=Paenarthrobacter sp. PH39-S1 TaxID=3046204 RepID=UPI0024BB8323|nr:helix-turn-helix domain-containing protein [Paenarthrobacter sp. PH39-S1]MDJ0356349.1 helix-turn-helix domain-containing protein [Paenarthrobacter sp. PH39-S1]
MRINQDPAAHASTQAGQWMSPQDVCDQLQIPRQTFYQWRAKHMGPPAYRFGKLIRIDRDDFSAWLAGHAEPSTSTSSEVAENGR